MVSRSNYGWNTHNEIDFIDGLISGKWREERVRYERTPIELLTGYIRHAKDRKKWGTFGQNVNPDEVIKYAQKLLKKL